MQDKRFIIIGMLRSVVQHPLLMIATGSRELLTKKEARIEAAGR